MKEVTLVLAYYENPTMLRRQFAQLRELPSDLQKGIRLVLVDDGSKQHPIRPEHVSIPIPVKVFRMIDDIRWNQDACRNLAMFHTDTRWALMTDMDMIVPEQTWRWVLRCEHDASKVYTFARLIAPDMLPYKPHPNSWLMTRDVFDIVGGYDERFAGLYGTDGDFKNRLVEAQVQIVASSAPLILYPRSVVADASTTQYARKTPADEMGKRRVREERARSADGRPLRNRFKWERVL